MDPGRDKRIVMTLDAGGTTFRFFAIRGNTSITTPVGISRLGTSEAISIGAYAFVLKKLEEER